MSDWQEKAVEMRANGMQIQQISNALLDEIGSVTPLAAYDRVRKFLKQQGVVVGEKPKVIARVKEERVVLENKEPEHHIIPWDGGAVIRFGLMGDTQINSNYTQLTHLHKFYDVCAHYGIDRVFHTGDIDEGEQMRPGHQYECYTQGADAHVEEIVKNYPKRDGITTYFITGNHDASLYKRAGMDIGRTIADKRPDMKYLGRDCAVVNLTDNCTLELRHPWDGTAYALSYKLQKMVEAMEADSKPTILAVGHYHKAEYFFYRNIHCFQTACFQGQTPFTRGKGISVHMGGWIVECLVDSNGYLKEIVPHFIPFCTSITDDWKNWR